MSAYTYPVHVDARLDPGLSRWQWLFKWLLTIPHYVVLAFLWLAFLVLSVVAFFAILFTGRYPRGIFDFNVGVLRWTWRVTYYAYGALGTDRYPPFSLQERADYPAHLDVEYPDHLSRGLVLVKWWLLAIPHYLVLTLFLGGTGLAVDQADSSTSEPWLWSSGLLGLLVAVAAVVLLFTGRYPSSVFDFVLGMNRWALRVAAYAGLMTDRYPPFRLDQGGDEPTGTVFMGPSSGPGATASTWPPTTAPQPSPAGPPGPPVPPAPPAGGGWTAGRVTGVVLASILTMLSLGVLTSGFGLLVANNALRDDNGFLMSDHRTLSTDTYALTSPNIEVQGAAADVVPDRLVGDVKFAAVAQGRPVFLGIARTQDVDQYLGAVRHDEVVDLTSTPRYSTTGSGAPSGPPSAQGFWAARASGTGEQSITWSIRQGDWTLVVMNADARAGVSTSVAAGAEVPALNWLVPLLLCLGAAGLVVGAVVLTVLIRGASRP